MRNTAEGSAHALRLKYMKAVTSKRLKLPSMQQKKLWLKKCQRRKNQRNKSFGLMASSLYQHTLHKAERSINTCLHGRTAKVSQSVKTSVDRFTCSTSCPILKSPSSLSSAASHRK
jgi:hypothetical protein